MQLNRLKVELGAGNASFDFFHGDRVCPEEEVHEVLREMFHPPFYDWYGVTHNIDGGHSHAVLYAKALLDPSTEITYTEVWNARFAPRLP